MPSKDKNGAGLRIIDFRAENLMRLRAVHIRPDGTVVNITGRNDQGKTSAIRSIAWALGGKDFATAMPLRKGEHEGFAAIDLGALKVVKRVEATEDGSPPRPTLTVEFADGSRPRSPQAVLDELRGELMDPIAFLRAKPAERLDMAKALFPDFDFAAHERERRDVFESRTDVNRSHKHFASARDAIALPPGPAPAPVDLAALTGQLDAANAANAMTSRRQAGRDQAGQEAENKRNQAERLRAQARALDREADELDAKLETAEPLPAMVDTQAITAAIKVAADTNAAAASHAEWKRLDAEATRTAAQAAALTGRLAELDERKTKAIAGGKLPFKGLAFAETDVEIDGVPWEQVAFSTRLRASAAIAIALAPRLHVMLITEFGSLLDADSMVLLAEIAEAHDFQVWIETVGDGGPGKVLIEDGRVVAP